MKTYRGTKTLQARPMNRADYNEYRGWDLPEDEDGADEGYLVEYMNGGDGNHPDHEGYISWSPKDVFEETYHELSEEPDGPLDFVGRMREEAEELEERLIRLRQFIAHPEFRALDRKAAQLLRAQSRHMNSYLETLDARISLHTS